jgi:hypothetical protein
MSVTVKSVVATAVKDANVIIAVATTVLAALSEIAALPFVPATDTHWITGAIVAGGVFVKVLKDVVADLKSP